MDIELATKIGRIKSLKSATIGVLIIYIIFVIGADKEGFVYSLFWVFTYQYRINILIGILIFYFFAYIVGGKAGYEILIEKKRWYKLIGVKYAMVVLLITAFLFGWTGYFQEGLSVPKIFSDASPEFIEAYKAQQEPFHDYVFKPFFWIMLVGSIPAVIVGMLFGRSIKKLL